MKKRYLVVTIFLTLLLFLPSAFAGSNDIWKLCDQDVQQPVPIGSDTYYCCPVQGNYEWQIGECCAQNWKDDCNFNDCDKPGGTFGCDGTTCSDPIPLNPSWYGQDCNLNDCDEPGGTFGCDPTTCSGQTPDNPEGYGQNCNIVCGNAGGTIHCDGTCSGDKPPPTCISQSIPTGINCGQGSCGTESIYVLCLDECGPSSSSTVCSLKSGNACFDGEQKNQQCDTDTTCGGSQTLTCQNCQFGTPTPCSGGTNCLTELSVDSDGSATAYENAGTVTDYTGCSTGSCTGDLYEDSCSGTILTEYGASGAGIVVSDPPKECQDFETNTCEIGKFVRNEWSCSGTPGQCFDTGTNTPIGTDSDGDDVDVECGDSLCDNAFGIFDSTKTATETSCSDGLDNDCDGLTDCADPNCAGQTGPGSGSGSSICCQSVDHCSAFTDGNCGKMECTTAGDIGIDIPGKICDVVEDKTKCGTIKGTCGLFVDSCTNQLDGSFTCNYGGVNNMCACGDLCEYDGTQDTYGCTAVTYTVDNLLIDYCDESIGMTCHAPSEELIPPGGIFTLGPQACTEQFPGFDTCVCHESQTCRFYVLRHFLFGRNCIHSF